MDEESEDSYVEASEGEEDDMLVGDGPGDISSDESDDEFDAELYKGPEDRYNLSMMTDMDRQAILYERGEKRSAIRQRNLLKAQLRATRGLPASAKGHAKSSAAAKPRGRAKAKVTAAESSVEGEAPVRRVSGKKATLDAIKEKRKADGARRRAEADEADEDYNSDDASGRGTNAKATKVAAPKQVKETARAVRQREEAEKKAERMRNRHQILPEDEDDPVFHEIIYDEQGKRIILTAEVEIDDLAKMMVTRDELAKWTESPHWDKTVRGAFVRVSLGMNSFGEPTYRIAEIVDYNPDGKTYELPPEGPGARPKPATMTISVAIGGVVKEYTLVRVSNKPFSPEEFEDWVASVKTKQQLALPCRRTALNVAQQLQKARTYVRTEADINKEIAKNAERMKMERDQRMNDPYGSSSYQSAEQMRDKHADMVSQINRRNRGVNSSVEAAYTPESAAESALNPFARLPTLTTQVGTKAVTPSQSNSNTSSSASSSANTSSTFNAASLDQMNHSSAHNQHHNGTPHRPTASPVSVAPNSRVISFAQYLNRR